MWLENYECDVEDEYVNCRTYENCVEIVIGCDGNEFISKYLHRAGNYRFNEAEISLYTRVIDFRSINISRVERQGFFNVQWTN